MTDLDDAFTRFARAYDLDVPSNTQPDDLPPGWRFGAHVTDAGHSWEGYWLIHEATKIAVVARLRPDYELVRLEDPLEADPLSEVDVSDLEAGLEAILRRAGVAAKGSSND